MKNPFEGFDVLEILRVGISGLLFLFSFLAYRLIAREQRREGAARGGILTAIYVFMGVNLLGAVLVAFSGSGPRPVPPPSTPESTYAVDYTSYLVDLSRWTETTHGPVVITRTDYVRKLSNKSEDYTIPYFTIGQSIECKPLTYSSKPQFIKKD